ncbi:MAG: Hpt domain-containing protein [Rhodospirillales bacterium]
MPNPVGFDGAGLSVLLSEDSAAVALLVRTLLARWGFVVHATPCDATAVRALSERSFDLVVLGATSAGAAAVADACGAVPILALTTEGFRLPVARAEADLPVNAATLADAVRRCLSPADEALDPVAIEALWGSADSRIYHRIARVFIGEVRDRVARIGELLERGDLANVEIEAHSIKGAAANVCAQSLRDVAATMEAMAAQGDAAGLAAAFDSLRTKAEAGIAALERLMA